MSKINELYTNIEALTTNVDNTLLGYAHIKNTVKNCQENLAAQVGRLQSRLNGNSTESQEMYDKVFNDGVRTGQKSEYDRFWDAYQDYGNLTDYSDAFSGRGWNKETFKPKYDMHVTRAENMFRYGGAGFALDLVQHLSELGVTLDFSDCTQFGNAFAYSNFTRIGEINLKSTNYTANGLFNESKVEQIDLLIFPDDFIFLNLFNNCKKLKEIRVQNIRFNNFNISWSVLLSKPSIISIVNALSSTTTGLTVTLSLTAVNNAFETSTGLADGSTSQEWENLVATKSNWIIALT